MVVMEAGFKICSGQEEPFFSARDRMMPLAMSQPGFTSVYGGLILNSSWLYFGVRFDTPELMDTWYNVPQHRTIQTASRKWWTAVYIRKWRALRSQDVFGERILLETRICRDTPLSSAELEEVRASLETLSNYNVAPFETLTGQFEPQPFQFVGPLEIAPSPSPNAYSLFTHWRAHDDLCSWQGSREYASLGRLGRLTSEAFIPYAEPNERPDLRADRLQRDWTFDGTHHKEPLTAG